MPTSGASNQVPDIASLSYSNGGSNATATGSPLLGGKSPVIPNYSTSNTSELLVGDIDPNSETGPNFNVITREYVGLAGLQIFYLQISPQTVLQPGRAFSDYFFAVPEAQHNASNGGSNNGFAGWPDIMNRYQSGGIGNGYTVETNGVPPGLGENPYYATIVNPRTLAKQSANTGASSKNKEQLYKLVPTSKNNWWADIVGGIAGLIGLPIQPFLPTDYYGAQVQSAGRVTVGSQTNTTEDIGASQKDFTKFPF